MNTPDLRIVSDAEGHRIEVRGISITLSPSEIARAAAALLSDHVPAFEKSIEPPVEPVTVPAADVPPARPKPSDIASSMTAPTAAPVRDAHVSRPTKGRIDVSAMPITAAEAIRLHGGVSLVPDAREWAGRIGADEEAIADVCTAPEEEWLSENAEVFYVIGDGLGLTVSTYDGAVLAVRRASAMDRFRPRERSEVRVPRGRGGSGRSYPQDAEELRQLLVERGFSVDVAQSGHRRVSRDGSSVNISSTPSDHRTVLNEAKKIERHFGVSLRKGDR